MAENDADVVIMLSSEKIAEVMEGYFNRVMLKQKVKVVDLQPTASGYAFSVAYIPTEPAVGTDGQQLALDLEPFDSGIVLNTNQKQLRNSNDKFVKRSKKEGIINACS